MNWFKKILDLTKMWFKKNGGTVLVVTAAASGAAAVGLAVYSTTKVDPLIDELKEKLESIESEKENTDKKEYAKALLSAYLKSAWKIAKLYGGAIVSEAVSITSLFAAKGLLDKRNAATVAALGIAERSFNAYRQRVIENEGREADLKYFFDAKEEDVEYIEKVTENGKVKTKTEPALVVNETREHPLGYSRYSFRFDQTCRPMWEDNLKQNLNTIKLVENSLTDRLRARVTSLTPGFVSLAEAKVALGCPQIYDEDINAGWIAGVDDNIGDDYISFNVGEGTVRSVLFAKTDNGLAIVLDPNCIGDITPYFTRAYKSKKA